MWIVDNPVYRYVGNFVDWELCRFFEVNSDRKQLRCPQRKARYLESLSGKQGNLQPYDYY